MCFFFHHRTISRHLFENCFVDSLESQDESSIKGILFLLIYTAYVKAILQYFYLSLPKMQVLIMIVKFLS